MLILRPRSNTAPGFAYKPYLCQRPLFKHRHLLIPRHLPPYPNLRSPSQSFEINNVSFSRAYLTQESATSGGSTKPQPSTQRNSSKKATRSSSPFPSATKSPVSATSHQTSSDVVDYRCQTICKTRRCSSSFHGRDSKA